MTGEYGNFTSQLKTAAIDKSWRTPPQIADSRNIPIFFLMPYVSFLHNIPTVHYTYIMYVKCTDFCKIKLLK